MAHQSGPRQIGSPPMKLQRPAVWSVLILLPLAVLLPVAALLFDSGAKPAVGELAIAQLAPAQVANFVPDAPHAPDVPEDLGCRHLDGQTNQVQLQWDDTNEGAANYELEREDVNNPGWNLLTIVLGNACANEVCQFEDTNASNSVTYRYRVRANDGNDTSGYSAICREPLVYDDPNGQFRVFYRLTPGECPTVDGKQTCTENVSTGGVNDHVSGMIATHEDFRQTYMALGFKDFALYAGAKPYPIDFYPCNNGCNNSQGIQVPPSQLEKDDYDPDTGLGSDYKVFVVGHEAMHELQGKYGAVVDPYYKWLIEGQARSTEDKSCTFDTNAQCTRWDDEIDKYYGGAAESYLGFPEQALLEASYIAALFWTYFVEQFGTVTTEPQYGIDALINYWEQNEVNDGANDSKDGIGTMNDLLQTMGSPRRFEDVFQDFAVANYLKDYLTHPATGFERYNYKDEESYSLNGNTYGSVKLTENVDLLPDDPVFNLTSVQAWGARYFQIDPDPSVPSVNIEIEPLAATPYPLYYHVVVIDNGNIISQYDEIGTGFNYSVDNSAGYDRIAVIVASMEHAVNFSYGFNLTDGIFILSPTTSLPAAVGELTSPEKFILQLQVLDEDGDAVSGIPTNDFSITVGSTVLTSSAVIAASYIGDQYWFTVRAPSTPGNCTTLCDLSAAYASYSDTKEDAILYGPKPDTDNMIIIDRSGSMGDGDKFPAAQAAAKLYADSYSEGDRIGIISFNTATNDEYGLTGWEEDLRDDVALAIDNIAAPSGDTANGAALREGNAQLADLSSPNPVWSIVLLSDGKDTADDANDHIPAYVSEWAAADEDGDQVPVVHVVAVGDDADGVELSKLTNKTGGVFQFLPVPSETVMAAGGEAINAVSLPEALSEIYRIFAEDVLDEQQAYVHHFPLPLPGPSTDVIQVDGAASQAIFVLKFSPPDATPPSIFLLDPDGQTTADAIPPTLVGEGHRLWRIPEPKQGEWRLGMRYGCGENCPDHFMVEAALVSDLTLNALFTLPVEERRVGKPMPILAFLSDIDPLTGATMTALSERTGELITLHDDGQHGDGAANDGAYGGTLLNTNQDGGYNVVIDAAGTSPFAGNYTRRARLAFYLAEEPDSDEDRLPDWWEIEHGTDPHVPDAGKDPDGDGLPNSQEYFRKTHPLKPDTDDGGENDGSEVGRGNNPLHPADDNIQPPTFRPWPGPGRAILRLTLPAVLDLYTIERAMELTPAVPGEFNTIYSDTVPVPSWTDEETENNQGYCYRVTTLVNDMRATSNVLCTTPKLDPHPPHGVVEAQGNIIFIPTGPNTFDAVPRTLRLVFDASDDPATEDHPPFGGAFLFPDAEQSGVTEMKISNFADFRDAAWEPYASSKVWTLAPNAAGQATVFVLFRDAAGNVSDVAHETFTVDDELQLPEPQIFLPRLGK